MDDISSGGWQQPSSPAAMSTIVWNAPGLGNRRCMGDLFAGGGFLHMGRDRSDHGLILERLDRFCENEQWRDLFPTAKVVNLGFYRSDHRVVRVHHVQPAITVSPPMLRFFYEQKWTLSLRWEPKYNSFGKISTIRQFFIHRKGQRSHAGMPPITELTDRRSLATDPNAE